MQEQLTAFPTYQIIVTGQVFFLLIYCIIINLLKKYRHSLGAAQALLAGMDLYQRDSRITSKNLRIFTNGMPRTGDAAFAYYVDSTKIPLFRSVNQRDSMYYKCSSS